ncbi:MAG: L-aspartate oxidase [Candidatus Caenarcaniphilales bacterium]|nr:L-aspartate oxidase [Candidatus Caenarcaniphilales bacterium]
MSWHSDVLVIGSGSAGLICALALAEKGKRVIVATKDAVTESSSAYAQGGIAVPLLEEDSIEAHVQDTLQVGAGYCQEEVVRSYIGQIKPCIERLAVWGMPFSGYEQGRVKIESLGLEGAHSHRRILKVGSDLTGRSLMKILWELACRNPFISISQGTSLVDLALTQDRKRCLGAYFQDINNNLFALAARATVLATGGFSSLYAHSTNPTVITGDGLAAAIRAGCMVKDLEFVQFHPTVLKHKSHFLLSEALRGEGALLLNSQGERFMERHDPERQELASRAVVSRAVWEQEQQGEQVYLDLSFRGELFLKSKFEGIYNFCKSYGFDLATGAVPITTAAHYTIGGVEVDSEASSRLQGLWATGEVSCTGLHGADRLASNSLLECIVSAFIAADNIDQKVPDLIETHSETIENRVYSPPKTDFSESELMNFRGQIREMVWRYASFQRNQENIQELQAGLAQLRQKLGLDEEHRVYANPLMNELSNVLLVADRLSKAIKDRKSSLGVHKWN